jgi:hypothetical protein
VRTLVTVVPIDTAAMIEALVVTACPWDGIINGV